MLGNQMAKKSKCKLDFKGFEDILHDIEKMSRNTEEAVIEAIETSGKKANEQYIKFISNHKETGLTEDTLVNNPKAEKVGNKIILYTCFDMNKGGMASLFLDKGTPLQRPYNFVGKIKKNKEVVGAISDVLEKKWEEQFK